MDAKTYLSQVKELKQKISDRQKQLAVLRELTTLCTVTLSFVPRGTNHGNSHLEDVICRITDEEAKLCRDTETLKKLKQQVCKVIRTVNGDKKQKVLKRHYLSGHSLQKIARDMGYSSSYISELHRQALSECVLPEELFADG